MFVEFRRHVEVPKGGEKLSEGQEFSCEEVLGSTRNLQSKYKLYAYNESNRIVTLCLLLQIRAGICMKLPSEEQKERKGERGMLPFTSSLEWREYCNGRIIHSLVPGTLA